MKKGKSKGMTPRRKLQQADELLYAIGEASPVSLIITRLLDGKILYANENLASLVGLTTKELIGQKAPDFYYDPEDRKIMLEKLKRDRVLRDHEVRLKKIDGTMFWAIVSLVIAELSGEPVIIGGVYDITDRKRAERELKKSEEQLRLITDALPVVISEIDADERHRFVNKTYEDWVGIPRKQIIGKQMQEICGEMYQFVRPYVKQALAGQEVSYEMKITGKDARLHYLWVRYLPRLEEDHKVKGFFALISDITDSKRAEEALRKAHDELEVRVQERTSELLRANKLLNDQIKERKRAEELARLQQQKLIQADKMASLGTMVSGVAHEINNPNNFILLNGKIISRVWDDVMPILKQYSEKEGDFVLAGMPFSKAQEKIGQLIAGVSEGAMRIEKIVQGLRDFSRQDRGGLNQSVDINSVVESALLIVDHLIKKSTNRFSVEYRKGLPAIKGNFQQLEQVIINLMTNACQAIQHREKGLEIFTSYDRDSDRVIIKVCDEGIGISPEDLNQIMDPFFTTKRDAGGTGLGLSISYSIIKDHGGDLSFSSEPGKGTTAMVTLPVAGT